MNMNNRRKNNQSPAAEAEHRTKMDDLEKNAMYRANYGAQTIASTPDQETPVVDAEVAQPTPEPLQNDPLTEEEQLDIVRANPTSIATMPNPSLAARLLAVSSAPYMLKYVEDQTPEIVHAALERDQQNFRYVKDKTPSMCKRAVLLNSRQLLWVPEQTTELCIIALTTTYTAIRFIKNPTEAMKKYAIAHWRDAYFHLENPTWEDTVLAATHHPGAFIGNPMFAAQWERLKDKVAERYRILGITVQDVVSGRVQVPASVRLTDLR